MGLRAHGQAASWSWAPPEHPMESRSRLCMLSRDSPALAPVVIEGALAGDKRGAPGCAFAYEPRRIGKRSPHVSSGLSAQSWG